MLLESHIRTILVSTATVIAIMAANVVVPIVVLTSPPEIVNAQWTVATTVAVLQCQMVVDLILAVVTAVRKQWAATITSTAWCFFIIWLLEQCC